MDFEWNENKNLSNHLKHGIDFEDAKQAFVDKNKLYSVDKRSDYGEIRYILIGKMFNAIIVVVYTQRESNFRIISARLASKNERKYYLFMKKEEL